MAPFQDFVQCDIGFWYIEASDIGISRIDFSKNKPTFKVNPSTFTTIAKQQLEEYFEDGRKVFDLTLDIESYSDFYRSVWFAVEEIPFGKCSSYSDIAIKIKNPKSVRAVGLANGKNPFPIVIPCHRVIGKDMSLTGYASGLHVKRWLLEHEGTIAHQKTLF